METCVRNNVYDKALEVAKFATVLYRRHKLHRFRGAEAGAATPSGADAIIWGIVSDVRRTLVSMRLQLLRELCSKLSLPSCLQIVGNLRTLYHHQAVFDGTQHAGADTEASVTHRLKVELLRSRSEWHMQQLAALPAAAPYNYVRVVPVCVRWPSVSAVHVPLFLALLTGAPSRLVLRRRNSCWAQSACSARIGVTSCPSTWRCFP